MRDPLQRLHKTKMALLATVFTIVGLVLLLVGRWAETNPRWEWLARLPVVDLGSALFTTGLVAVVFSYLDGQDSEERAAQRLERVLTAEAPAIRDAVIDGFAFKREDLARVATPETLDNIISNSLALRLGDEAFAADIYRDIREQAIRATERWYDARILIRLSRDRNTATGRVPLLVATVSWEYSVRPSTQLRRFTCVGDRADYREQAQNPTTSVWYVNPRNDVDPKARSSFELVQFALNGDALPIRRTERASGQSYSVNIGEEAVEAGELVTMSYTYRTVVPVRGHLLHLDLEQPTKGVDVELDFSDCGIDYVNVVDFIASSERTRVIHLPDTVPGQRVSVGFDGWVFPRSGVAFVWVMGDRPPNQTTTSP